MTRDQLGNKGLKVFWASLKGTEQMWLELPSSKFRAFLLGVNKGQTGQIKQMSQIGWEANQITHLAIFEFQGEGVNMNLSKWFSGICHVRKPIIRH